MHLLKYCLCNRSGTEEEYSELQQLLHDIHAYRRDRLELENKQREKQEKEKTEKEKGEQMRAAAPVGMASEFVFGFKCFFLTG